MTTTTATIPADFAPIAAAVDALNALPAEYLRTSGPATVTFTFDDDDREAEYEAADVAEALLLAWQQSDQFGTAEIEIDCDWGSISGWVSVGGWMTGRAISVRFDGLDEFVAESVECLSDWQS